MSRLRRLLESHRVFFITTHFVPEVLPIADSERDIILQSLAETRARRKLMLLAYCLMPTHLHLLVAPSDDDRLSGVMREVKIRSAKRIQASRRTQKMVWQARYFDRIMRHRQELSETLEYIHLNPVKDGLVKTADKWPWSSWPGWQTDGHPPILVDRIDLAIDAKTPLRW
ncbi:MAG: REP-associated tyrosine transposase [Candidatus Acidiferrales bacterium]